MVKVALLTVFFELFVNVTTYPTPPEKRLEACGTDAGF
jgi:hypothetical protein